MKARVPTVKQWRLFATAFYVVALVVCVCGAFRFESNIEDVFQWLPDETSSRTLYDDFVDRFGTDDFLVVTWPGYELADARSDRLPAILAEKDVDGLIARVDTSRSTIRTLVRDYRLPLAEAVDRLRGLYVGRDGKSGCAVFTFTARGMDNRRDTLEFVKSVCEKDLGIKRSDLILAGYPVVGDYGDRIVRESLQRSLGPCCLISTIIAWLCLRSLRMTLAIFATGGLASGLSIAFVTLSGAKWGGLSSVIPSLAYLLSLSNALHLVNYARSRDNRRVIYRVIALGWKPCVLSALTTAVGMLSLCLSDYPAIREFGFFCATGVLGSLVCQLILMPVLIDLAWDPRQANALITKRNRLFEYVVTHPTRLVILFLSASIIAGAGLPALRSDMQVERNFSSRADVMQDIARLEETLGPLEQTELIIRFANATPDTFLDRIRIVRQIETSLKEHPEVNNLYSVTSWLPEEPEGAGVRATAARVAYRSRLTKARKQLAETPYLDVDDQDEHWRLSLRFPYFGETDFTDLDVQVRNIARNQLQAEGFDASVRHTGVVLLYYVAQNQLINDLLRNFAFAFLAITPLMAIALRSIKWGLIAMIPNVCPALISYGVLGWIDYPVDIGMVMAACVGLGIAVDDTTHFMLRVQDLQGRPTAGGESPLRIAFGQCSRAMLHTTLISGLGLSAFLPGDLLSMTRFTALLIAMLVIALLCDLILLPALLVVTKFSEPGATTEAVASES